VDYASGRFYAAAVKVREEGLLRRLLQKKDFYAGGLLILFGLGAALKAPDYGAGTLMHMGPGFMPTALGVILVVLGVIIAGAALSSPPDEHDRILPAHPQWFAWGCILAGPFLFVVVGSYLGMLPGTFACVFVSALGDRTQTWKSALVLASVVSVFGVGLFSYLLEVPMPVLTWGSGS
jgi:putative Ca2+/H+ antiporter (TMEM165/GDT1 family)